MPKASRGLVRDRSTFVDLMSGQTANPDISRLTASKRPAVRYAVLFLLVFCSVLVGLQTLATWRAREQRLAETGRATENMARALAAQGESAVRVVDTVLAGVVERVERDGLDGAKSERLRLHLRNMVSEVKEVHGLFVYDARGNWLVNSLDSPMQSNNSDREYFQHHLKNPSREVYIGKPVRSRSSGFWILPVSRRLQHPDGSFAGVALGTIRIDFFAKLYESFQVGRAGIVLLLRDDGTLIYRRPYVERQIGMDLSHGSVYQRYKNTGPVGTAMMRAKLDGIERLYSYRHLDTFPLIVATALSKEEILAEWRRFALGMLAINLLIMVLLCGFGGRLIRQIMIRDRLERELVAAREALQRRNEELSILADNDGLTGIANRRRFEQALQLESGRAARNASQLSLVMLDVDFFKKYNDTYGHVAGDECLRRVAAAIGNSLGRTADLVARYGGEEFVVLLPDTSESGALRVAERIRTTVQATGIAHAANPPGVVTISAGVCTIKVPPGAPPAPSTLLECADALLYQAKLAGRNRVCSARDSDAGFPAGESAA